MLDLKDKDFPSTQVSLRESQEMQRAPESQALHHCGLDRDQAFIRNSVLSCLPFEKCNSPVEAELGPLLEGNKYIYI